jgi:nucleoside-diphosphate-sugar epimerase
VTALLTGGAGFVGTNLAARLLSSGERVVVLDDLSRPGVERNLQWLRATHPDRLQVVEGDVRDADDVRVAAREADRVFHFAAQVAVTTSVTDPVHDYSVNLGGTITLLEELRRRSEPPPLLFTSTNKVYGKLAGLAVEQRGDRYEPADDDVRAHGIGEHWPLQFASPYGCSKGGADQYVLDYAHTYGMPHVVFRMSCIYGPHQRGNEDQGWLAHFLLQARDGARSRSTATAGRCATSCSSTTCWTPWSWPSGRPTGCGGRRSTWAAAAEHAEPLELLELIATLGAGARGALRRLARRRSALLRQRHPGLRPRRRGGAPHLTRRA